MPVGRCHRSEVVKTIIKSAGKKVDPYLYGEGNLILFCIIHKRIQYNWCLMVLSRSLMYLLFIVHCLLLGKGGGQEGGIEWKGMIM